jgi:tetratricopeptide (TPR) repeat protein
MKLLLIIVTAAVALGQETKSKPVVEQPEFYDEPTFVVSGVTDYTYRGGHGSDALLRSTEALAAATASLKKDGGVKPGPANPAAREHAVAEAAERRGDALEAVRAYQRAAELDASESNLFDWGAELLTHRAADPAIEVFTKGARLFPNSMRMRLGLAVAFYMRGDYDRAAERLFEASDLDPADPTPYMFLGRVQSGSITKSPEYLQKLKRFAALEPNNAWANYYYAACLEKRRVNPEDTTGTAEIWALLEKAIRLDPTLAEAYLLLGVLYAEGKDLTDAVAAYQKAVEINPNLEEAHYRLSQAYEFSGEKTKARQELAVYRRLADQSARESERERRELQQFVFTLRK